jgi:Ion transport protein
VILAQENWVNLMHSVYRSYNNAVPLFLFVILTILGNLILLNLFFAILVSTFTNLKYELKPSKKSVMVYAIQKFLDRFYCKCMDRIFAIIKKNDISPT